MTHRALLLPLPLLLVACGGTWSNRDLEFASALPSKEQLRAKLPTTASGTSPLTGGLTSRRDGLLVGDPSQAYQDALSAQKTFNGILDFFLSVVDVLRTLPPTSRTADSRTWGPYPDSGHSGYQFAVTVHQTAADAFTWRLTAIPTAGGDALTVVDGAFTASASGEGKGSGALVVHLASFKVQLGVDAALQVLDQIELEYRNDVSPLEVGMKFTFQAGASTNLSAEYHYLERDDRSGALAFQLKTTILQTQQLDASARWTAQGAGMTTAQVTLGTYLGASVTECWDSQFKVTFFQQGWLGGQVSGVPTSCPTFP